jgi:hypothetical protein
VKPTTTGPCKPNEDVAVPLPLPLEPLSSGVRHVEQIMDGSVYKSWYRAPEQFRIYGEWWDGEDLEPEDYESGDGSSWGHVVGEAVDTGCTLQVVFRGADAPE